MMNYTDLLVWIATNPFESFFLVLFEFFFVMKIHLVASRIKHEWLHNLIHYPLAVWFIPQDFVVNVVLFTIIGVEWPEEYLVSARVKRWSKLKPDSLISWWRYGIGIGMKFILNSIDKDHIR